MSFRIDVSPYAGGHQATICYGRTKVVWTGRVHRERKAALREGQDAMRSIVLAAKQWERENDAKALAAAKFKEDGP